MIKVALKVCLTFALVEQLTLLLSNINRHSQVPIGDRLRITSYPVKNIEVF